MISLDTIRRLTQNYRTQKAELAKPFFIVTLGNAYSNFTLEAKGEDENGVRLVVTKMNNSKELTLADVMDMIKLYEKGTIILDENNFFIPTLYTYGLVNERFLVKVGFEDPAFAIMIYEDLLAKVEKRESIRCARHVTVTLDYLEKFLTKESVPFDFDPVFQRGNVWTREQEIAFMENFIRNPLSVNTNIYFNDGWLFNKLVPNKRNSMIAGKYVCLDGLQRLTAIRNFIKGEYSIFGGMYWNDIQQSPQCDRILMDCDLNFYETTFTTNEEVLNFYIDFNAAGSKHSEDEIQRVRDLLLDEIF